ncbi:hypothetical protein NPX13_g2679 [Xylaria arbuscula]|uniref:Inositol oxygenase n=1 Tax=Xylaria arbuscula TaxID=114810 RepID=A0A9W8TQ42_9PEZI|nr:hypothetical protein NPX13_g2679 [Xylaria arbuscula]
MAPGALVEETTNRDGLQLEETSDNIDKVNVLKDQLKEKNDEWTSKSKFDDEKDKTQFRQYEDACDRVKTFYKEQHTKQTVAYNLKVRNNLRFQKREEMTIWEAMEKLNTLIDESDPDTSLSQIQHLLQSAEAIRRDGKPRWTAAYRSDPRPGQAPVLLRVRGTKYGIYSPGCGLDNIMLSWGHDEYLYEIVKNQSTLPPEALAMIRYHSFYPWHKEGAYREFMNEHDEKMLEAVRAFNPYDLYSKSDGLPDAEELKPYYMELIDETITAFSVDRNARCAAAKLIGVPSTKQAAVTLGSIFRQAIFGDTVAAEALRSVLDAGVFEPLVATSGDTFVDCHVGLIERQV